jgi:hypothetical protein
MEAEGDNHIIRFIFTGEDGEVVPADATHVTVHESVKSFLHWHSVSIVTS